jgi:hypothetical protein
MADGLILVAVVVGALFAGAAIWAMIAMVVGAGWALAIIISTLVFSGLLGLFYASAEFDPLDENEDGPWM